MKYDAVVIGAGQAGPGIAAYYAQNGKKAAIIEADRLGGTCLNYGCRPTKTLRASARVAHIARRAAEYGINGCKVEVDFAAVMARKDRIIGEMQESTDKHFHNLDDVDLYYTFGRFLESENGLYRIQAGDDILETEHVFINVGARALIPPIDGIQDVDYLTNVEILALEDLPEHLVILGGSYIGLEFGQMFRRFGSEVTIIEGEPHLASREDEDVSEIIEEILTDEDITIYTNHYAQKVSQDDDGTIQVEIEDQNSKETRTVSGTHLLVATGRKPNTDKLNLEAVGVETDKKGYIKTNAKYETGVPGIWALGDVNGLGAFTHTSYQDSEILIANFDGGDRSADERTMTYAMFTDPPLGRLGMNEREARDSDKNVLISTLKMENVSRAQLDSETQGIIKVLVDADTEEIIGALTFGMHGDDLIQVISNFMYTGASYKVMRDALPVHPTIAEFLPTILQNLEPLKEHEPA